MHRTAAINRSLRSAVCNPWFELDRIKRVAMVRYRASGLAGRANIVLLAVADLLVHRQFGTVTEQFIFPGRYASLHRLPVSLSSLIAVSSAISVKIDDPDQLEVLK